MKHHYFILGLLAMCMSACMGGNSVKKTVAVYDFGVTSGVNSGIDAAVDAGKGASSGDAKRIQASMNLEKITAVESLNQLHMRYRLNYENPARLFFYSESRWLSPPAELVSARLNSLVEPVALPTHCNLKLKLQLFDQVFSTPQASNALVQLDAVLLNSKTRKVLASRVIAHSETAPSANAQGGVLALAKASDAVVMDAIAWANAELGKSSDCH